MSAGLLSQLEAYGEVFASAVDARALEETMRTDQNIVPIDPTVEAPTKQTTLWKPVAAALGAAAVFIAVVVGITAVQDDSTVASPPFSSTGSAVETLTVAENTGDWDLYRAALDDEATVDTGSIVALSEREALIEAVFFYNYGTGRLTELEDCGATLADGGVGCTLSYQDGIGEALGLEPVDLQRTFRIVDGRFAYVGGPEFAPDGQPPLAAEFVAYVYETGLGAESDDYFTDPTQWNRESAYDLGRRWVQTAEEFMAGR